MMTKFQKYNINTIFLHCRAFDDAFYVSKINPPSIYCSDENGSLKFDILQSFIDISKNFNMEIHCWINPYRIRNDNKTELINKNSLAGKWYSENSETQNLIITENFVFYNPASVEAQEHILNSIKEILDNYEIHGIHIDDYFYPTTAQSIDSKFYKKYKSNGGKMSLQNYRRENINSLVSSIYSLVKFYDNSLIFSISLSANIDANYNTHYADVWLWASQKGYADYLIPQIYYGFQHEKMPFDKLLNEWCALASDYVNIAIGLAVYKCGTRDKYAGAGSNEWIENNYIIENQISKIKENPSLKGYSYYSSSYLKN